MVNENEVGEGRSGGAKRANSIEISITRKKDEMGKIFVQL